MDDDLYPPLPVRAEGLLDVGDGHRIFCQDAGNPDGKPVVVLHGGPGSGIAAMSRRHFDPDTYRIIQFDQRGAGRSTPNVGEPDVDLATNTLWHLVSDMELLRERLNIERWQLFGGSWGSTLALAYAQTHPSRVSEIVLRGVFTVRSSELDWIYRGGAANLFPAEWEEFLAPLPESLRKDPLGGYAELLASEDRGVRERAAIAWSVWEGATVALLPQEAFRNQYASPNFALTFARLAVHYFRHGAWLEDGQLIRDAGRLAGIPGVLVQGRYDAVCPPITAYQLHRAWPGSSLQLTEAAGHAVNDPGILAALRAATDGFR
ncbi:prolyl aminopeptidase [Amycolatopsis sp. NBC_01480]|jgi:proline iminopeptidase|uniref:prolyl aminopeptidase n=1 Tax=Amycolatopsis sp. NBC_01480 TaxID=2903562 RepID=UPI002E2AFC9A|nr:prolyl aminopeptidase [Amycolatopsis sp. NBC_01480]